MSILIAYNYTADEDIVQGEALALSPDTSRFNDRRVVLANSDDKIVGVAMQSVSAGQAVALAAFVTGQSNKCLLGEDVAAGDKIWVGSDGVFVKNADSNLIALDAASSGELVEAVYNAADPSLGDITISGNVTLDADSKINFGDETLTAPSMSGPIGIDTSGVGVVEGKTTYAVGAISFLVCQRQLTWYSGTDITGANLAIFRPMYLKVASDGTFIVQPRSDGNFVIAGTWRVLVGSMNDTEGDYNIILAQRIM